MTPTQGFSTPAGAHCKSWTALECPSSDRFKTVGVHVTDHVALAHPPHHLPPARPATTGSPHTRGNRRETALIKSSSQGCKMLALAVAQAAAPAPSDAMRISSTEESHLIEWLSCADRRTERMTNFTTSSRYHWRDPPLPSLCCFPRHGKCVSLSSFFDVRPPTDTPQHPLTRE